MSPVRGSNHPRFCNGALSSAAAAVLCGLFLLPTCGCNTFGNGKLVQELQNENTRLLAEFRAERDRREQADQALETARGRLAESEKLLALQNQLAPTGRLSRLPPPAALSTEGYAPPASFSSELRGVGDAANTNPGGLKWQRRVSP